MISQMAAIRLLEIERYKWKRDRKVPDSFRLGFMEGISFAIAVIRDLGKLTAERMKNNPRYLQCLYKRGA